MSGSTVVGPEFGWWRDPWSNPHPDTPSHREGDRDADPG